MTLEQYQSAIETSNIVSKTDLFGVITFVNSEFCKISGYSEEELVGQNHNIVRHPDVLSETFKNLWDTIKSKKTYIATVKNRAKDGSTFYVNTTVIPILDENDEIKEFIAIRYDVTKNIELTEQLSLKETELEELNRTLEERVLKQTHQLWNLNQTLELKVKEEVAKNREKDRLLFRQARLASMGEMIGNIAHQWRQPLSELSLIIYNMKKIFLNKSTKDFLESYESSKKVISQMSQTIDDFRNFFNPNCPKEIFSMKQALNEALLMMKGTLKKEQVTVTINHCEEVFINGYLSEFSHVFLNLLNNSKDAFKENLVNNRKITIEIKKLDANYAIINFRDNAGGMDEKILEKIFEPYFTTKHASVGTGLGLYMSRMIVQNSMNGTIKAKNYHDGINFYIKIPACKEEG